MTELAAYLSIAGLAHRRLCALSTAIENDRQQFPSGEQITLATEVASCEAIISTIRSVLAGRHCILEFSEDGKARARVPFSLQRHGEEQPELEP